MEVVAKPSKTDVSRFPHSFNAENKFRDTCTLEKRNCARSIRCAGAIVGDGIFRALSSNSEISFVAIHPPYIHPTSTSNESGCLSVFPSLNKASSLQLHPIL